VRPQLDIATHQLQEDNDVVPSDVVIAVGVEADGPIEATNSEGGLPNEFTNICAALLLTVVIYLEDVRACMGLNGAT